MAAIARRQIDDVQAGQIETWNAGHACERHE